MGVQYTSRGQTLVLLCEIWGFYGWCLLGTLLGCAHPPPPLFCMFPGKYVYHPSSFSDTYFSHCCLVCRSLSFPLIPIRTLSSSCKLLFGFQNGSSNFLWNDDNFYQVTWCHIPDDNMLHYFSTFSVDSKNCEKWPCLSVHHHGTTVLPLDEF
jgi:hypothetical protein